MLVRDNLRIRSRDLLRMLDKKEMSSSISLINNVKKKKLSVARLKQKRMLLKSIKSVSVPKLIITMKPQSKTDWTISKRVKSSNKNLRTIDKK